LELFREETAKPVVAFYRATTYFVLKRSRGAAEQFDAFFQLEQTKSVDEEILPRARDLRDTARAIRSRVTGSKPCSTPRLHRGRCPAP